nr:hypothetical protein [Tanacetum cinerariifolium]
QELLEYMGVHNIDASESSKPSWGKDVYIRDLVDFDVTITSKGNEEPSWNTSFKTKSTQKTTSALEVLWKTLFNCILSDQHYIVLPLWSSISSTYKSSNDKPVDDKPKNDTCSKTVEEPVNKEDQAYRDELDRLMSQENEDSDVANALRKEFKQ